MSRSGYHDDHDDNWALIRWRGAVKASLKGKRGQDFLREMIAAMDTMPVKELAANSLVTDDGCVCALGAVAVARGMDVAPLDPEDIESVAPAFGISAAMAREIVYENDECGWPRRETPTQRWQRMRKWAESWLVENAP